MDEKICNGYFHNENGCRCLREFCDEKNKLKVIINASNFPKKVVVILFCNDNV